MTRIERRSGRPLPRGRKPAAALAAAGLFALGGCSTPLGGALTGAALGAGSGAGISALTGNDADEGAAIGTIGGALGGAVLGDQNQRRQRQRRTTPNVCPR